MTSNSHLGELSTSLGAQTSADDAVAVAQLLSHIAGTREQREDHQSSQTMATAAQAATAATVGAHQAELNSISTFLSRHLQQQQQHLLAANTSAHDTEYSMRVEPAAGMFIGPGTLATVDSDADRTESTLSAAKSLDLSAGGGSTATPRRRKTSDESTMQKLQALADVSEERLAKQEKRMMKNRESAARSRLRRQQHTEALEEQNAGLKQEVLALRTQMAVLQTRVSELEWQLQIAQAAAGRSGAAPAVIGPAAPTPSQAAALAAAVSGAAGALNNLHVQASQPLSNTPLTADARPAASAAAAAAPGLPPLPSSWTGINGCGVPSAVAADGGRASSNALIDALAMALSKAKGSNMTPEQPSIGPDHAAADEAVSAEGAVAALLGMAGSYQGTTEQADQYHSGRPQLLQASGGAFSVPGSSRPQQQKQEGSMLPVTASPLALQQQQQTQAPQTTTFDANQLLMATTSRLQQNSQALTAAAAPTAAGQASGVGALGALLAALQQAGVCGAAAVAGHASSSALGMASMVAPEQGAVQTDVAAMLQALQAATAPSSHGNGVVGSVDSVALPVAQTAAVAAPAGVKEGERPSKRVCP